MVGSIQRFEPEAYELLDQRDEDQILAEIKGNIISEMFYSFPLDGKTVTGVSWVGTKEIARQYGCIDLDFVRVDDTDDAYIAVVKATDTRTGTSLLGTAMQPKNMKVRGKEKPDRFAYTKAVSKAQRNAIRAIIPERFLIEMYELFKNGSNKPKKNPSKNKPKKVKAKAKIVEPEPQPDPDEEKVVDTLLANDLKVNGALNIYKYGNHVVVQPPQEIDQESWNNYNSVLGRLLNADWNQKGHRWEIAAISDQAQALEGSS